MGETRRVLVIVRHALRDKVDEDNGLNAKGWDQAHRLAQFYRLRVGERPAALLSSPKVRCIETLSPIAQAIDQKIVPVDLLDEQKRETGTHFRKRIRQFLAEWREANVPLTLACSHGDWIPVALGQAIGFELPLKKGAWCELNYAKEKFSLSYLAQAPLSGARI